MPFPGIALKTLKRVPSKRLSVGAQFMEAKEFANESLEMSSSVLEEEEFAVTEEHFSTINFEVTEFEMDSSDNPSLDFASEILRNPLLVKIVSIESVPKKLMTQDFLEKLISFVFNLSLYYKIEEDQDKMEYFVETESCNLVLVLLGNEIKFWTHSSCQPERFTSGR